jgi:hypothetical protein
MFFAGHSTTKARPMTFSFGTMPLPGWLRCSRESAEADRWSPITHSRSAGTRTLNRTAEGGLSGNTYGSSSATPLTVTLPLASQQTTSSPGTPITRLIRSFSLSAGSSPT